MAPVLPHLNVKNMEVLQMGHVVVVDPAQLGLLLLAADVVREVVIVLSDAGNLGHDVEGVLE